MADNGTGNTDNGTGNTTPKGKAHQTNPRKACEDTKQRYRAAKSQYMAPPGPLNNTNVVTVLQFGGVPQFGVPPTPLPTDS